MTIDNFFEIRRRLEFKSQFDRYVIHVIKRAKDDCGKAWGSNETCRLLKTLYIASLEYFDRKAPVVRELCAVNSARAYILPQVRDNSDCLKELLKLTVDNLSNPTARPDHLVRSAYCGNHRSRDKRWVLDLDPDNMAGWTPGAALAFCQKALEACGKDPSSCYMLPTAHGHCVVTPAFDLQKAQAECPMLFQGEKHGKHGWLLKDGMALLYYKDSAESGQQPVGVV